MIHGHEPSGENAASSAPIGCRRYIGAATEARPVIPLAKNGNGSASADLNFNFGLISAPCATLQEAPATPESSYSSFASRQSRMRPFPAGEEEILDQEVRVQSEWR